MRIELALTCLAACAGQLWAQPLVVPNDPLFHTQASFFHPPGIDSIDVSSCRPGRRVIRVAPGITLDVQRAWSMTTGSRDVVVAILDDGFFYWHEDLRENLWHNPGESGRDARGYAKESNGIDDDGNGYRDDVLGWDFVFDDPDPDPYVYDGMDRSRIQPYWHSMGALGIIGARGNNGLGIAGINWEVSLMLLKIGAQGTGRNEIDSLRADRAARAIRYAADNGARIINWSGYVSDTRPEKLSALKAAIAYAGTKNVLIVVPAGNEAKDLDDERNCIYPQCFDADNVITVAEVDFDGRLYRYVSGGKQLGSNYGARRVHIAALGENFSTSLRNQVSVYGLTGGTSNAAPVVSGVAALMVSVRGSLTATELKKMILRSATPVRELRGKILSGGVVSASGAVRMAHDGVLK